jgi:hypothetical protein
MLVFALCALPVSCDAGPASPAELAARSAGIKPAAQQSYRQTEPIGKRAAGEQRASATGFDDATRFQGEMV